MSTVAVLKTDLSGKQAVFKTDCACWSVKTPPAEAHL